MAKPVPEGYHTITPYISVKDAAAALEFYKVAFGAKELVRMRAPNGKIGHAELQIGDARLMLADEYADTNFRSPRAFGGSPVHLVFYVEDVDNVVMRAVAAGAKLVRTVADEFYGDRTGALEDPFGHVWHVSTHIEDVPVEEIERRMSGAVGAGA